MNGEHDPTPDFAAMLDRKRRAIAQMVRQVARRDAGLSIDEKAFDAAVAEWLNADRAELRAAQEGNDDA